jgi:hypothetical protein
MPTPANTLGRWLLIAALCPDGRGARSTPGVFQNLRDTRERPAAVYIRAMAVVCSCCSMSVDWWVRLRSHPDLPICHNCLDGLNGQRVGQLQLITGKWLVTGFEPIFKVSDVSRSVAWFERAGFEMSMHDDTYAFAHRDRDLTIHLAQATGDERAGHGVLYLHCQEADRVAEEWRRAGIEVDGPRDEDYGKREGSITDPDGNVIRFGSAIR